MNPLKRAYPSLSTACAAACVFILNACFSPNDPPRTAGTGSQTENAIVAGRVFLADGTPAQGAEIFLRRAGYLRYPSGTFLPGADPEGRDVVAGKDGSFRIVADGRGSYRLETRSGGTASAIDVEIQGDTGTVRIPPDTLSPVGSVRGRVGSAGLPVGRIFAQVYGVDRLVAAGPDGSFLIPDLPPGTHTIRAFSDSGTPMSADSPPVEVEQGKESDAGDLQLRPSRTQAYVVRANGLALAGVGQDNPLIYDAYEFRQNLADEYMWARTSLGANLVGIIASRDMFTTGETDTAYHFDADSIFAQAQASVSAARLSGIAGLPDPVRGPTLRLDHPSDGNPLSFKPAGQDNPGSRLIISEAKKASREKPLLVICDGQPISAAHALLLDSTIADRMIVFTYEYGRAGVPWDAYLVAKMGRMVNCDLRWTGEFAAARIRNLPANPMTDALRALNFQSGPSRSEGSVSAVFYLFRTATWKGVTPMLLESPGRFVPGSASRMDFLHVQGQEIDAKAQADEFFSTLANPKVYGR